MFIVVFLNSEFSLGSVAVISLDTSLLAINWKEINLEASDLQKIDEAMVNIW